MSASIEIMNQIIAPKNVWFPGDPRSTTENLWHSLGLLRQKTIDDSASTEAIDRLDLEIAHVRFMHWTPLISVVPVFDGEPEGILLCDPDLLADGPILRIGIMTTDGKPSADQYSVSSRYNGCIARYTYPIQGIDMVPSERATKRITNEFTRQFSPANDGLRTR